MSSPSKRTAPLREIPKLALVFTSWARLTRPLATTGLVVITAMEEIRQ